ncbi:MAG: MFS transporter [Chthoniobacterales bacterium]|nr:MFS transporter [Chthoniobacterales bacterium]
MTKGGASPGKGPQETFSVGTLTYDKRGLWLVFFWLMWNDFSITLLEQVTSLNAILMRDRGASYTLMASFATIGGLLGMGINPIFSTWSDRCRTRFGRRRPFLLVAAPLFAVSLSGIAFMPDFYHFLTGFESAAAMLSLIPINGEVLFIGLAATVNGLFNAVVLAIFTYYYWDVVPEVVLGRFNSLAKIVTVAAGMVWSFWVIGYAEHHTKIVYIGVSAFCLTIYMVSVWRVREGQYPPPEPRKTSNPLEPITDYFRDCFTEPYYLWIFFGTLLFQLGNLGGNFQFFYLRYDLGMDLATTGWINGVGLLATTLFGLFLGYTTGSWIDRLKPVRVLPATFFVWAGLSLISFFYIRDKESAAVMAVLININMFAFGIALGAVTVELFPRSKIGQFCSAQAFFYQTLIMILNPLVISPFFDWLKFNRGGYLWSAAFQFLAGLVGIKIYYNWKQMRNAERRSDEYIRPHQRC